MHGGVPLNSQSTESAIGWLPLIAAVLCALAWLTPTPAAGSWLWDFGNGLGFVAFALVLVLSLEPGRSRLHRPLAWLAVGAALVHGGYLLALDATLLEYLKPTMPAYMAAGLLALALLVLSAVFSGKARRRIFPGRRCLPPPALGAIGRRHRRGGIPCRGQRVLHQPRPSDGAAGGTARGFRSLASVLRADRLAA